LFLILNSKLYSGLCQFIIIARSIVIQWLYDVLYLFKCSIIDYICFY